MDLDELALWAAWHADYDPGFRGDLRAGVIAATIANAALGSKGRHAPQDFFPTLRPKRPAMSEAEIERRMLAWCAAAGGAVKTWTKDNAS